MLNLLVLRIDVDLVDFMTLSGSDFGPPFADKYGSPKGSSYSDQVNDPASSEIMISLVI